MDEIQSGLRDIAEIRALMERSTKFLSLSGYAGIGVGLLAFVGAWVGWSTLASEGIGVDDRSSVPVLSISTAIQLVGTGVIILGVAVGIVFFFSRRLARTHAESVPGTLMWQLGMAFTVPLLVGGVLCTIFLFHGPLWPVIPAMLLFYGLALFSAGSFTFGEVRTLGALEILVGLVAAFLPQYGILLWALGFGLLHIIYGILFFRKYRQ